MCAFDKVVLALAVTLGVRVATAGSWYAKPGITNWFDKAMYYNNDGKAEAEMGLPTAGDVVYLSGNNGTFYLDPAKDPASFELVNGLRQLLPEKTSARLQITVSGTSEVDFNPAICDFGSSGVGGGTVVKLGTGTLNLNNANTAFKDGSTICSYNTGFDVREGVVRFPQGLSKVHLRVQDVNVAEGATVILMSIADTGENIGSYGFSYMNTLAGAGLVTNVAPLSAPRYLCIGANSTFDGILGGGIVVTLRTKGLKLNLTNPNSTYSGAGNGVMTESEDVQLGLRSFMRRAGDAADGDVIPTAMGLNTLLRTYAKNSRFTYLGTGGETFFTGLNAKYSPVTIDAGATGGCTFEHGNEWGGYYGSKTTPSYMQHLILDGSNAQTVVFRPYMRVWTDCMASEGSSTNNTWYVTKRGTGTWFFDYNAKQDWRGGLCVEDGKVQFDRMAEAGVNSPFGKATMCQVPYCGKWDPASNVTYAIALGGTAATPVLEYVGSNIVNNTTRHLGLNTQGAVVNAGRRPYGTPRFCLTGVVSTGGNTEKTLVLDGTNETMNTVTDIADGSYGGTVGVTKRGSGNWTIAGPLNFSGRLKVEQGTLYVNDNRHYRWFKFTPTLTRHADPAVGGDNDYQTVFAEFALYDANGARVNSGMRGETYTTAETDNNHAVGCGRDYTAIAPGRAALGRYAYANDHQLLTFDYAGTRSDAGAITVPVGTTNALVNIFDGTAAGNANDTFAFYNRTSVTQAKTNSWLSLYMHVTNTAAAVAAYDFAYFNPKFPTSPYSWRFEGSVNGLDWTLLDEKTAYTLPADCDTSSNYNCWSCTNALGKTDKITTAGHTGWPVPSAPADAPTSDLSQATVQVAAGGALIAEGDFTIAKLSVSAEGAGLIDGFAFASEGVLDLCDVPKVSHPVVLSGRYEHVTGLSNLANWAVRINGKAVPSRRVRVEDGQITVLPAGLVVIVR